MSNRNFHLMCKPTSYKCNLKCDYCFYLEKESIYKNDENCLAMPENILKQYIKQYIESQYMPVVEFAWQGGEPTMAGLAYFEKIIKYQKKYAKDKTIRNTIQTNGILINNQWASFFAKHDFLIGISLDGMAIHHDKYRVTISNKGTFEKVRAAIELLKKYNVEFNTLTVVNSHNVGCAVEIYQFLKSIGSTHHQYIPVIEHADTNFTKDGLLGKFTPLGSKRQPFSVPSLAYGEFMIDVFNEWVKADVGKIFIQLFDASLFSWCGYESTMCVFNKECGQSMVIERNGDLYPCDHYVYPEFKIGNVMDGKLSDIGNGKAQLDFGSTKANISSKCKSCEFMFACNGGCSKHRTDILSTGENHNYLCDGYYKYFKHVDPYMKFMANELINNRDVFGVMTFANNQCAEVK